MAPTGGESDLLMELLSPSEVGELHAEVRRKISSCLVDYKKKLHEVEAGFERYKINSEQRYFELEREVLLHKDQLGSQADLLLDANRKHAEAERSRSDLSSKISSLQGQLDALQADKGHLEKANVQLKAEKDELVTLLDRKAKEIQSVNDEWKSLSDRLMQVTSEKCEAVAKLEELQSKEISLQYREARFEQEKAYLQQQIDWLNGELTQKSADLFSLKKGQAVSNMELHHQLELKIEEAGHLQETLDAQRKSNEQQLVQINTYIQRLKDVQGSTAQVEEQYRRELQAQHRLVELYKASSEEAEEKVKELMTAVSELQRLLGQVTEECKTSLAAKEEHIANLEEAVKLRDDQIHAMDLELKSCNELLKRASGQMRSEEVEAMSPAAAAASRLLRSGMTLTQIYSEYVQTADALTLEKEENKRLHLYLDQIVQEIEEKAPTLKRQRDEYEHALIKINSLTSSLEQAMLECERERISADEANKKASTLIREEARLKQENKDLSLQVQILLKEVEQSCGNFVSSSGPPSPGDRAASADEVSSSAYIITDRLVTFRNVEELQAQNQKLLRVVRELSEDREAAERATVDARTAELQKQLASAQQDIEELRAARLRQVELVESIVRQRDMYRVMLSQAGVTPMPAVTAASPQKSHTSAQTAVSPAAVRPLSAAAAAQTPKDSSSSTANSTSAADASAAHVADLKAAMKELQEEFVTYKQERQKNEKMLADQTEALKKEQSDLRLQNAQLASQLEFSAERFKALQANADGYRRELDSLRTRNAKHSAAIVQHEQTIASLREETMAVQERLARSDARCQSLAQERDLLKTSESRLIIELESMRRERSTSNVVLTNLMAIQNNLERTEFELKTKYGSRTEAAERENVSLKKKLEAADERLATFSKALEDQLAAARDRLEKESVAHQKTREELMQASVDVSKLKHEISVLNARAAGVQQASAASLGSPRQPTSAKAASDQSTSDGAKIELQQATAQIDALKEQLEKSRQHAEQYKAIAESIEQSLRDQNEASKQFKEAFEKKLEDVLNANAEFQRNVQALEKERQDLMNDNIRISEESHQLNADLRKQLASLQNELETRAQQLEAAASSERLAREELIAQTRLAQEAQDRYERELLLHAANVERLNTLKHELENFNTRLTAAQDSAISAEVARQSSQASWQEREKLLMEEASRLSTALDDANKQRELLHDQLENLSAQMATLGRRDASSLDVSFGEESTQTKSTEQLLEVIRFLRREKEIAETKLEISQAEASRARQRLQLLEHQVDEMTRVLATEREKTQAIEQTAAQHAELLRKVEQLNLLSDSNRLLREEKERLAVLVQESELKAQKLAADIEPLRQQLCELEGRTDALETDKKLLQSEVERWRTRTNQLIEQSNKADPEELRKATNERDDLKKKVISYVEENQKGRAEIGRLNGIVNQVRNELAQYKQQLEKAGAERDELKKKVGTYIEENQKHRAETTRLNTQLVALRNELTASKQQNEKLTTQLNTLRTENAAAAAAGSSVGGIAVSGNAAAGAKDGPSSQDALASSGGASGDAQMQKKVAELNRQLDEKEKIVVNLRKIGRKYKQQYEDLQKELSNRKSDGAPSSAAAAGGEAASGAAAASSSPPSEGAESAAASSAAVKELSAKVEQLEEERSAHLKRIAELEAKINLLTSGLTRLEQDNSTLKSAEDKIRAENAALEAKVRQNTEIVQKAKSRLQSLQQEIAQLHQQNQLAAERLQQQQRASEAAQAEMREQHEADMRRLESELQDARRAAQELLDDLQQQQQLQAQQPAPGHPTPMPATSTVSVSTTSAGDHPTANIRPLTSPASAVAAAASGSHPVPTTMGGPHRQMASAAVPYIVPSPAATTTSSGASLAVASAAAVPTAAVPSSSVSAAAAAVASGRMTASIRPMSQSRTATVMPTTLSAVVAGSAAGSTASGLSANGQQVEPASSSSSSSSSSSVGVASAATSSAGGHPSAAPSPAADAEPLVISVPQASAVRRLQAVQPVSPRLDDAASTAATSSSAAAQGVVSTGVTTVTTATIVTQSSVVHQQHSPEPDTSSRLAAVTAAAAAAAAIASAATTTTAITTAATNAAAAGDDQAAGPSTAAAASESAAVATASVGLTPAGSKRARADEESPESSTPDVKKARPELMTVVLVDGASATAAAASAASEARTEEEEEEMALGQEPESLDVGAADAAAADMYAGYEATASAAHTPGEVQPVADETSNDMEAVDENEAAAMPAAEDAALPIAADVASVATGSGQFFGRAADSAMPAPSDEPSSELQEVFIEGSDDGGGGCGANGGVGGISTQEGMPSGDDIVVVEEDVESVQDNENEPDDDEEGNYGEDAGQVGSEAAQYYSGDLPYEGDGGDDESDQERYVEAESEDRVDEGQEEEEEGEEEEEEEGDDEEEEEVEGVVGTAEPSGDESRSSSSSGGDHNERLVEAGTGSNLDRDVEGTADDDDDVVVVDDDDEDAPPPAPAAAVSSAQPGPSGSAAFSHAPSMSHQMRQSSRRQLTSAVTRLHSFHGGGSAFMSQTSVFGESNEDGVVPSTPTLFVPKRTDGFAEAVSSPYRAADNFLFAAGAEAQPDFGQLASQVYMDDIRDLSQYGSSERPHTSAVGSATAPHSTPYASQQPRPSSFSSQQPASRPTAESSSSSVSATHSSTEQIAQSSGSVEPAAASRVVPSSDERDDRDPAAGSSTSAEAVESGRSEAETWDDGSANFPSSSLQGASASGGRVLRRGGRSSQPSSRAGLARSSRLNRPQFRSDQQ